MLKHGWWLALAGLFLPGCVRPLPPPPDPLPPGAETRRIIEERSAAVMVVARESIQDWADQRFARSLRTDVDLDGGSAAPITPDGYFLTADHVLSRVGDGRHAFVIYGFRSNLVTAKARVVWRSAAGDLALLHAPLRTPLFFRWTPPQLWLPEGSWVMHGGVATGRDSPPGRLATTLAPEGRFTGSRRFKLDFQLRPGDSGGPVTDARGQLIGINSAVEFLVPMDTAFFVDSEGCRPSVRAIEKLIRKDRLRKIHSAPGVG
jgi:S1-C subfamily serine protease